jgi:hypothetical protein
VCSFFFSFCFFGAFFCFARFLGQRRERGETNRPTTTVLVYLPNEYEDAVVKARDAKKNMKKAFTIRGVDAANFNTNAGGGKHTETKKKNKKNSSPMVVKFSGFLAVIDPTKLNEQLRQFQEKIPKQFVDKETGKFKLPDFKAALEELREERQHMEYHPDRKRLSSVADFFKYTEEEGAFISSSLSSFSLRCR